MNKHVNLLGILYLVSGGVNVLLALSLFALGAGAAVIVRATGERASVAAGVTATAFMVVAAVALIWGAANLWAGSALRQLRPTARVFGLVVAALNIFVLPFGTPLGIYGLWVLLNEQTRPLFEPPAPVHT